MTQLSEIVELLKSNNFSQAVTKCRISLKTNNHPQVHLFLGIALGELKSIDEASSIFRNLLNHFPKSLEILFNYALILEKNNLDSEAIKIYESCLRLQSNHLGVMRNLSYLYFKQKNFLLANQTINQLLAFNQNDAFIYNLKGLIHMELKQANLAIDCFNTALQLQPEETEYLYNKATALAFSGQTKALNSILNEILMVNTHDSISFIASLYEKTNKLDEALQITNKGLSTNKKDPDLLLILTKILKQKKLYSEALESLDKIKNYPNSHFYQEILYEKANILDKSKQYKQAWDFAKLANNESHNSWVELHKEKDSYNKTCLEICKSINDQKHSSINSINNKMERKIAFILGFTRSGTTLIDTVLSSHTEVEVLEEVPLIKDLSNQFPESSPRNHFNQLLNISNNQQAHLRNRYFDQIPNYLSVSSSQLIIDKSPLNTSLIAFIKTVFPESKIIFSVRHPLDVCVSCFFQQFEFNSYMTNMVTPKRIAMTYDAILNVWKQSIEKFNINVHYQRYESLVSDFEIQSKSLTSFLGLDWQDQMLNFQSALKTRAVIPNPSYNQVSQPIYQTAKNRYKNYFDFLGEAIEILEPWIKYFDYKI